MELKFNYVAVGKDGSRQNGSLTAQSEIEARAKLHSMGFSILKITVDGSTNISHNVVEKKVIKGPKKDAGLLEIKKIYEFSGFKGTGEEVGGNIEAKNKVTALKRLYDEYKFSVTWLVENALSPAIKEHKKKTSVNRILAEAFDEGIFIKAPEFSKKKEDDGFGYISKEEKDAIEEDVKKYIAIVKDLSKKCNGIITGIDLTNLQKQLIELEKIQKSNNLPLIQSELEDLLRKTISFFNDTNKEDLPEESLENITDISSFLGADAKDFIAEKILPFLGKFSFLKDYLAEFKRYLDSKKDSDLIQRKNNLKRYVKRFFFHLRLYISSHDKIEREKRFNALKKTFSLISSTYKTYSIVKDGIKKNKDKYYLEFRKGNIKIYNELRFVSALILGYYFIYFLFIDFGLRKGIFVNYELGYFTIGSNFILMILFLAFLINLISFIKIKYFLKNIYFNLFFGFPIFVFMGLFYYMNY